MWRSQEPPVWQVQLCPRKTLSVPRGTRVRPEQPRVGLAVAVGPELTAGGLATPGRRHLGAHLLGRAMESDVHLTLQTLCHHVPHSWGVPPAPRHPHVAGQACLHPGQQHSRQVATPCSSVCPQPYLAPPSWVVFPKLSGPAGPRVVSGMLVSWWPLKVHHCLVNPHLPPPPPLTRQVHNGSHPSPYPRGSQLFRLGPRPSSRSPLPYQSCVFSA